MSYVLSCRAGMATTAGHTALALLPVGGTHV